MLTSFPPPLVCLDLQTPPSRKLVNEPDDARLRGLTALTLSVVLPEHRGRQSRGR